MDKKTGQKQFSLASLAVMRQFTEKLLQTYACPNTAELPAPPVGMRLRCILCKDIITHVTRIP
eukprot:5488166-Amphidinium_carterae.1